VLRKLLPAVLLASLLATIAHAAGPSGPGPAPSPWIVSGNSIYYPGSVLSSPSVPGGAKGSGTYNITGGYYVNGTLVSGMPSIAQGDLLCNQVSGSAVPTACTWNQFASLAIGTTPNSLPFYTGSAWGTVTTGVSVSNPGTGTLENLLVIQTVTGASKTFGTSDLFQETRRSNGGSAMTDTFPPASASGVVGGTKIIVNNVDSVASDTLSPGAGTTISGTGIVPPGRSIQYAYDIANTTWRPTLNTASSLLSANNLSDLSSIATARANLIPSGTITNAQLANPSTTVNGQTCTLGGTCTVTASAGSITYGTTTFLGGTGIPYNTSSGGFMTAITLSASGVLVTNGSSVPSISTTLPSGLSATNMALTTPSLAFGTGSTQIVEGTSANTGFSNQFLIENSGTVSNSSTSAEVAVVLGSGTNTFLGITVTGGASPSASLSSGGGLTGGLTISAGAGALNITTPTISSPTFTGTVSGSGTIPNAVLVNSSTTVNGQSCALGGTCTVTATATATLTFGTHLTSGGSSYNGSVAVTISTDATNSNTASTIVARDGSGNFLAGTITASLTGHASLDLSLSGGTMSGALAMGTNNITGVGNLAATTINGNTFSTGTGTLTLAAGKTLTDTSGVGASVLLGTTGGGFTGLAGNACTNQHASAISAAGVLTCSSVTNAFLTAGTFSSITGVGTLTAGATGAGFTVALGTSTVTGQLALTNGGTNASLTASAGGVVYSTASAFAVLAGTSTAGQCLLSGNLAPPTWGACSGASGVASVSNSDGSLTVSPNTGAVVISLSAARQTKPTFCAGFPGAVCPTTATSGTYTVPSNALYVEVYFCGGGGGGGGSGTASAGAGGTGGTSIFNSINAVGGGGGAIGFTSGNGNTSAAGLGGTGGTGTATFRYPGSGGGLGGASVTSTLDGGGGNGGAAGWGFGGGARANGGGSAAAGQTPAGFCGGGGGAFAALGSQGAAGGGGGGETVYLLITSPAGPYSFTTGAGGTSGAAGTSGQAGGAGALGGMYTIEHYGT
jgi:hypothetical protein